MLDDIWSMCSQIRPNMSMIFLLWLHVTVRASKTQNQLAVSGEAHDFMQCDARHRMSHVGIYIDNTRLFLLG